MKQKKIKEERKESEIKAEQNGRLIENKIIRDIRTLFEQEEDYYKPKRVVFESNGDKTINLSLDEYINKIEPYLKDIIIDLQSSDT